MSRAKKYDSCDVERLDVLLPVIRRSSKAVVAPPDRPRGKHGEYGVSFV